MKQNLLVKEIHMCTQGTSEANFFREEIFFAIEGTYAFASGLNIELVTCKCWYLSPDILKDKHDGKM